MARKPQQPKGRIVTRRNGVTQRAQDYVSDGHPNEHFSADFVGFSLCYGSRDKVKPTRQLFLNCLLLPDQIEIVERVIRAAKKYHNLK